MVYHEMLTERADDIINYVNNISHSVFGCSTATCMDFL